MITQLRAANFKCWRDTGEISLAPLTGLFGTNSSGKSSVIQILLMLKQTVESSDRSQVLHTGDDRSLVDLGTFYDVVHSHQPNASIELSLSWSLPGDENFSFNASTGRKPPPVVVRDLRFKAWVHEEFNRPVLREFRYNCSNYCFGMVRRNSDEHTEKDTYDLIHDNYKARRVQGRGWPLPSPVKCYGFPDEATGYYQNTGFLPNFVLSFEKLFSRVIYLGPLREYPKRTYVWAGERPMDVGRRGEHAVAALLAARVVKMTSGRGQGTGRRYSPIEERILEWMKSMGIVQSFSLKPIAKNRKDFEFRVKQSRHGTDVLITDVGFGVSQILPVLVLCYYVPEGSTILLEQPEIHLHPSVQADLADVLIDVVNERNVQVIVESHSEHFLHRLQRRIAEEKIPEENAALYFCQLDKGESKIERLNLDTYGNITNWPRDFFGDEMGDLGAMTKAAMKRQMKAKT